MMYAQRATSVLIVVLIVGSACLVGESVRALRRGKKQEGQWVAASAMAMLGAGLGLWLLRDKFASALIPYAIAGIPTYAMLYCLIQIDRCHLGVSSGFRASMVALAIGFAVNGLVLVYLLAFPEGPSDVARADPLVGAAALAIVLVDIIRHERLHKRSMK